jgi:formate dehydrogenase subunit gamma
MTLRAEAHAPQTEPSARVRRFGRTERWVHRTTAALMGICVATAACLYIPEFAELVGRRELVVRIHELAGVALPVPVLAACSPAASASTSASSTASARTTASGCAAP